jgi:hypothetical protein
VLLLNCKDNLIFGDIGLILYEDREVGCRKGRGASQGMKEISRQVETKKARKEELVGGREK